MVKARFGTKVKVTFVQADMGEDCELDSLSVYDSGDGILEYPGLYSQCGEDEFPPSYDKVISDGPVTVKYDSVLKNSFHKIIVLVQV